MFLLIQLLTLPASAGLMCGLTQTDVEGALTFYGSSQTYQDVSPYVTAPFACVKYGNLCDVVGGTRAPTYVCDVWSDAVAHVPQATLAANADADLDALADAWEAELFPTGIADSDPWWGTTPPPPSGCDPTVSDYDASVTHKARVKAFWMPTGIYNYTGGSTKGYLKSGGRWTRDHDGDVSISVTTVRLDWSGSECRFGPWTKSDTDGFVRKIAEYGIFVWPSKYIESTGSYYGITLNACATAPWADPGC